MFPGPAIVLPGPSGFVMSSTPIIDRTTIIRPKVELINDRLTATDPLYPGEFLREKEPAEYSSRKWSTATDHPEL